MTFKPHPLAALALLTIAAAPARFTAPMQPWTSPDGQVSLLRPAAAPPTTSDEAISTVMPSGWRLAWGKGDPAPGRMIVRLRLDVASKGPSKNTSAGLFQVGVSRDPAVVKSCLRYGLDSGNGERKPDRVINGVRYGVWENGDFSMGSGISSVDLRAVVDGACYAVERFGVSHAANDDDPKATLPEASGKAELDATLASLRVGHGAAQAPALQMPSGAVAR